MAPAFDDLPELMTVPVVADYLHMSQEGVRRLIRLGRLEAIKPGKMLLVRKDSLREFVDATRAYPRHGPKLGTKRSAPPAAAEDDEPGDNAPEERAAPASGGRRYVFSSERVAPRVIG